MKITRSPEVEKVIGAVGAIQGVRIAPKFRVRGGMLYIGDYFSVELRLVQTVPSNEVSVFLEKLAAVPPFRIAIGSPMQTYGLIRPHDFHAAGKAFTFYSLPDGLYAGEFAEAFSGKIAAQNLAAMNRFGYSIVLASQQVEVVFPCKSSEADITSCISIVLESVKHSPWLCPA